MNTLLTQYPVVLNLFILFELPTHLGGGDGGKGPLVLQSNGSPYRGFFVGRVEGDTYVLLMHLSSMELKKPAAKAEKEAE
jgi:hypothetical protein